MDFLRFFGLKKDPFKLVPDPAFFYPSPCHNEGLLLMDYSIRQKEGFLLIIGDPGTGKTTMLNVFLKKWKAKAEIAIILTPRLSPEEFLSAVAEDLDINIENMNKNEIIKSLRDFMTIKASKRKRIIIIVDEAQNLPDETLEELRLLSNIETSKDKLLQIILSGQPELEARLRADNLRQLNQRIANRVYLKNFNPDETLDYINFRIAKAGRKTLQVHRKTCRAAHKLTKGIPRLINMLISRALMAAYLEESSLVLPRHIDHAVKSLNHSDMKVRKWPGLVPAFIGSLAVILVTGMLYIYLQTS
jgi:general secretion pathway protein A